MKNHSEIAKRSVRFISAVAPVLIAVLIAAAGQAQAVIIETYGTFCVGNIACLDN